MCVLFFHFIFLGELSVFLPSFKLGRFRGHGWEEEEEPDGDRSITVNFGNSLLVTK